MRRRLTTWWDLALTVAVFAAFVPLLVLGGMALAARACWIAGWRAARDLIEGRA